ncbi:hypothetical protein [Chitinophaga nivalis]|uniref:Uncharacterized protein n=1 Tax=Chitinophaga nivalis TaxID=2991709 RepID=A0ABT3IQJ1_9BACT|nr:hypothetical protein [Chitinophaga nivalis]MCW3464082.1 hypothetical protein [Chitinophaga nivalis]MCW3486228.1 hypothetical protein [Chitinophaga nivalis]
MMKLYNVPQLFGPCLLHENKMLEKFIEARTLQWLYDLQLMSEAK